MKGHIPIKDYQDAIGEEIESMAWVDRVRDLRNIQFVILRDKSGKAQGTNFKQGQELDRIISDLSPESVIKFGGRVQENPNVKLGGLEVQLDYVEPISIAAPSLPIEDNSSSSIRMDWRYLDLRSPEKQLVFDIQTTAEHAMREYWMKHGFTEIHSPKLVAGASESGAELFELDYFGTTASLAQSPQFYKQMAMAAGMERVFEIGPVFRANSSHTYRHDTEFTSIDTEFSWINSHEDIMEFEEQWLQYVIGQVAGKHGAQIEDTYGKRIAVPTTPFPRITHADAKALLAKQGHDLPEDDLDAEGEKILAAHIKKAYNHDFVFVTEYPSSVRPFYHMRFEDNPDITKSFDLLWDGLEVTTGAQREHRHDVLLNQIAEKGAVGLGSYPDFFKYGCPPHGGYGFGLTRMLMNLTGLPNVRETTFVYRGPNRINP